MKPIDNSTIRIDNLTSIRFKEHEDKKFVIAEMHVCRSIHWKIISRKDLYKFIEDYQEKEE